MRGIVGAALVAILATAGVVPASAQSSGEGRSPGVPQAAPPTPASPGDGAPSVVPKMDPARPDAAPGGTGEGAPRGCRYRERQLELIV